MPRFEYTEAIREKMRQAKLKNPTRYWLGKKFSDEYKVKLSEAHKGQQCWNEGRYGKDSTGWKGGKPNCKVCGKKLSSYLSKGCKKHNASCWKGGITKKVRLIRSGLEIKLWRESVFKRNNWTCQECGIRGGILDADHIKQFAYHPDLRFVVGNGRTLCRECHRKTKSWGERKHICCL